MKWYVTLNLSLTYSSNCFPPCTYLLETGVKDAIEQWREWDYIQFLRVCILVRLVRGPINISDNQNRFKLSWAITIQLWKNIEIPIVEFTVDNDNFKSLVFWLKKSWKNANSYLYYRKQNGTSKFTTKNNLPKNTLNVMFLEYYWVKGYELCHVSWYTANCFEKYFNNLYSHQAELNLPLSTTLPGLNIIFFTIFAN